jgi:phage head maturation protease
MSDDKQLPLNGLRVTERRDLTATLERAGADADARTVPLTISSETPVAGPGGTLEVLSHDASAIDLARAARGLPLQISHNARELPVGRVEGIHIDGTRLRGVARFSRTQRGEEAWSDVADGIISDVSIGAMVEPESWQEDGGMLRAMRWQPVEVSLVSMGADPAAGINRGGMMDTPNLAADRRVELERDRTNEIAALFSGLDGAEWVTLERDLLRDGASIEVARTKVMTALKAAAVPTVERHSPDIRSGEDGLEKWCDQAEQALTQRMDLGPAEGRREREAAMSSNELAGMTLREIARDYLRARGERVTGMSPERLVDKALRMPALVRAQFSHSTSDFGNILGASAETALATGYQEAPETYAAWTRNVTMSNFRAHTFTNLSLFGDLDTVTESAEYTAGTFSDRAESATLTTYGKLFTISRQAIVNDDLNAFNDIPRKMGRASARKVGDLVYGVLTTDAVLSDQAGATLFNTTDGNLAASATVIDTANMSIARNALRTMTDPSGATLNIQPAYLLVPSAIETTAQVFLRTAAAPGGSNNDVNVFQNSMQLVVEPRLDADDVNAWYVMGMPGGEVETVVVGWLNGRQEPFLEQEEGFSVDGMRYKVRIDCTAKALDWRGMYQNAGA